MLHCDLLSSLHLTQQSSFALQCFSVKAFFRQYNSGKQAGSAGIVLPAEKCLRIEMLQKGRELSSQVKNVEQIAHAKKFCNVL